MDVYEIKEKFRIPKEIQILEEIGKGGFSWVYKIKYKGEIKALKIIKNNILLENEFINWNEYNIINKLSHPNIIKLEDSFFNKKYTLFIFDYYKGGNLTNLLNKLKEKKNFLNENKIRIIIKKIIIAVKYIHSKNIIHRDLKPDNILLDSKSKIKNIVLIDFGLSLDTTDNNDLFWNYKKCGTKRYMAPEVFINECYDNKIDIWSTGIILYMLSNKYENPLKLFDKNEISQKLKDGWFPDINSLNSSFMLKNLLSKMFILNPKERYNINQVLNHPWVQNNDQLPIPYTKNETMKIIDFIFKFNQFLKTILLLSYINKNNKFVKIIKLKLIIASSPDKFTNKLPISTKKTALFRLSTKKKNSILLKNQSIKKSKVISFKKKNYFNF